MDEDEEEDNAIPAILPLETVENAIKAVAKRVNYGLDPPEDGGKVPAAWLIWRWEVLDACRDWLPKAAKEKVDNRFRERQQVRAPHIHTPTVPLEHVRLQAKNDAKQLFMSLPEDERIAILGTKTTAKPIPKQGVPGSGVLVFGQTTHAPLKPEIIDLSGSEPVPATAQPLQPKSLVDSSTTEGTNANVRIHPSYQCLSDISSHVAVTREETGR